MARSNPSAYAIVPATTTDVVRTKNNELIAALNDIDQNGVIGSRVTIQDEGSSLAVVDGPVLNFVGAGVAATGAGQTKTITIPGGSVSSSGDDNQNGVLRTVNVANISALNAAVAAAIPGDDIVVAAGIYVTTINGITPVVAGTKANPIRVRGVGPVVIQKTTAGGNLAMNFVDIDYWIVEDIEFRTWNQGVILIRSDHNIFRKIRVHETTVEAYHIRSGRYNLFEDCWAYNCSTGEGFYIGSDSLAWATYTDDGVGTAAVADYTIVRRAKVWNCQQECLEIKENTTGCIVEDCTFDHTGQRTDTLFVAGNSIKGHDNIIRRNSTIHLNSYAWNVYNGSSPSVSANNNLFEGNDVSAAAPVTALVDAFHVTGAPTGTRVKTTNTVTSGTLSNVATEA